MGTGFRKVHVTDVKSERQISVPWGKAYEIIANFNGKVGKRVLSDTQYQSVIKKQYYIL